MGSVTVFSHLVHAGSSYLNFHPFAFRAHYSCVQTLITVALRRTDPVAQALWAGMIKICNNRVYFPAVRPFLDRSGIDHNADGKQVVDLIKRHMLGLHFLEDTINGFRPSEYFRFESLLG